MTNPGDADALTRPPLPREGNDPSGSSVPSVAGIRVAVGIVVGVSQKFREALGEPVRDRVL